MASWAFCTWDTSTTWLRPTHLITSSFHHSTKPGTREARQPGKSADGRGNTRPEQISRQNHWQLRKALELRSALPLPGRRRNAILESHPITATNRECGVLSSWSPTIMNRRVASSVAISMSWPIIIAAVSSMYSVLDRSKIEILFSLMSCRTMRTTSAPTLPKCDPGKQSTRSALRRDLPHLRGGFPGPGVERKSGASTRKSPLFWR